MHAPAPAPYITDIMGDAYLTTFTYISCVQVPRDALASSLIPRCGVGTRVTTK